FGKETHGKRKVEANHDANNASDEGDENSLRKKLKADFTVGGANGFADTDLAYARRHGSQHDVHDADSTYQQYYHGDEQKHPGQCGRGFVGHSEKLGEILHGIYGLGAVPRLQDALDLVGG